MKFNEGDLVMMRLDGPLTDWVPAIYNRKDCDERGAPLYYDSQGRWYHRVNIYDNTSISDYAVLKILLERDALRAEVERLKQENADLTEHFEAVIRHYVMVDEERKAARELDIAEALDAEKKKMYNDAIRYKAIDYEIAEESEFGYDTCLIKLFGRCDVPADFQSPFNNTEKEL